MAKGKRHRNRGIIPGWGLTFGYTLTYLSLLVLLPLSVIFVKASSLSWEQFWHTVTAERVAASLRLSFAASLIAAFINAVFGVLLTWVLVRYDFPGKRIVDGLVDLPFALPTAVAGIALTTVYAPTGAIGQYLDRWGVQAAYTPLGIVIALTFIGLPFVVRTIQPVLQDLDRQYEEAAAVLGANRWQTFRRVVFPPLLPALCTGFSLAFARALGEYGSVVFISGNMPMKTEIAPLLIVTKLEQYDYAGATAIAAVVLLASFLLLLLINWLQWRTSQKYFLQ
ncbi:sulfate ABC transporter permease subunit CysT [Bacillaceae bacterium]